jgi:hypothetical protein
LAVVQTDRGIQLLPTDRRKDVSGNDEPSTDDSCDHPVAAILRSVLWLGRRLRAERIAR